MITLEFIFQRALALDFLPLLGFNLLTPTYRSPVCHCPSSYDESSGDHSHHWCDTHYYVRWPYLGAETISPTPDIK